MKGGWHLSVPTIIEQLNENDGLFDTFLGYLEVLPTEIL